MVEPRPPKQTVKFVDEYCLWYKKLFSDVRNFEAFKYLHSVASGHGIIALLCHLRKTIIGAKL